MSELTFKASTSEFNNYNKQIRINDKYNIYLTYSPLANCQISSMGSAYVIFYYNLNLKEILKYLRKNNFISNMILFDINQSYKEQFTKVVPKKAIVFSKDYLNKTGSKMFMSLVDVSRVIES